MIFQILDLPDDLLELTDAQVQDAKNRLNFVFVGPHKYVSILDKD